MRVLKTRNLWQGAVKLDCDADNVIRIIPTSYINDKELTEEDCINYELAFDDDRVELVNAVITRKL